MKWDHNKRLHDDDSLRTIESDIASLKDEHGRGCMSDDFKSHLTSLVAEWDKILKDREESWRL